MLWSAMTRLVVWFSFIIIFNIVGALPRINPKGKIQKKLVQDLNVGKSNKRSGDNEQDNENSKQYPKGSDESGLKERESNDSNENNESNNDKGDDMFYSKNVDDDTVVGNASDNEDDAAEREVADHDENIDVYTQGNNEDVANEVNEKDAPENSEVDVEEGNANDAENIPEETVENVNEEDVENKSEEVNEDKTEDFNADDAENKSEEENEGDAEQHISEEVNKDNAENKSEEVAGELNEEDAEKNIEGDAENNEESANNQGNENEEENELPRRPLKYGDILTPQDLLPVTSKLIQKVDSPGEGKGIVSSAKSPEILADRLFEAFFLTKKRIINLSDFDISCIDALQALALSGDVVEPSDPPKSEETAKRLYLDVNGQRVKINKLHKTCKYSLITKEAEQYGALRKKSKRHGPSHKKRRLFKNNIGNKSTNKTKYLRREMKPVKSTVTELGSSINSKKTIITNTNGSVVTSKNILLKSILTTTTSGTVDTSKADKVGRWRYECKDPSDLDTCHLEIKYIDNGENKKPFIGVKHKEDEHTELYTQFRKMMKLSLIDEEVEKIIELRVIRLRPGNKDNNEKIETLNEYFNIIMNEHKGITMSMGDSKAKRLQDRKPINEASNYNKNTEQEPNEVHANGRRILGIPSIPTPRPYTNKMYLK